MAAKVPADLFCCRDSCRCGWCMCVAGGSSGKQLCVCVCGAVSTLGHGFSASARVPLPRMYKDRNNKSHLESVSGRLTPAAFPPASALSRSRGLLGRPRPAEGRGGGAGRTRTCLQPAGNRDNSAGPRGASFTGPGGGRRSWEPGSSRRLSAAV